MTQPATQTKTEATSAPREVCDGGPDKVTSPCETGSIGCHGYADYQCRTNHNSLDAINRLVQAWQKWLGQPTKALHRVVCLHVSPQGCGQHPIGAGPMWVEMINDLIAFGCDRAHGSAGGSGAGGATDEGTESNGILRDPNEGA